MSLPQDAMIFGYILIDLDMFSSIPLIWKHSAVSETSNESQKVTETSNECRRSHGALHPARSLVCSSADQAKGASPCKVGGLVEIQAAAANYRDCPDWNTSPPQIGTPV